MVANFKYTIEKIDIDGDGVPDGDLISQWRVKAGKPDALMGRKFVPFDKMEKIAKKVITANAEAKASKASAKASRASKVRLTRRAISDPNQSDAPVQVQDKTNFVQYVKLGAGVEVGRLAVDAVAGALADLF